MCYLIRQTQSEAERGGSTPSPSLDRLRSRWIGAVAAVLIGGVAVAALVGVPSTPPLSNTKDSAPAVRLAPRTAAVPTAAVVEQTFAPLDDGVPTASDVVKAGLGHCQHDL
jgi:hypothetical protein